MATIRIEVRNPHNYAVMFKPVLERQLRAVIEDAMRVASANDGSS